ncbi:hypothetical protein [Chryseobacterium sp. 7]|uniref:hypothetical protein n=1 Tax=Chryseobacterium sp. 7 TaxID=2035214 RepID=UPI001E2F4F0D|nr:hypothetical protein [Chryseobacterium sp. 7]
MRKLLLVLIITASLPFKAQEIKKDEVQLKTKMDLFTSKTGSIIKFTDTRLPPLKTSYSDAETKIRKITSGSNTSYFYQIVKDGKYANSAASIEYSDLLEVIKALKELQLQSEKDTTANPDYIENKFITVDGFQVGYYVDRSKKIWFLKLEKYGSDNTLFINDVVSLDTAFNDAKNKIEELKLK